MPPSIQSAGGTSTWNFNGGCLKAEADSANFMQGLTNAYVQAGGAVIDTDIYSILIAQPLLDGGGNGGLTKNSSGTLTLSGNLAYTGLTTVNDGSLIMDGAAVSIGSASILGGSLQVDSPSAAMHDISGNTLIVGDGSTPASLTADSVNVGTLTLTAGATLTINAIPGGSARRITETGAGTFDLAVNHVGGRGIIDRQTPQSAIRTSSVHPALFSDQGNKAAAG